MPPTLTFDGKFDPTISRQFIAPLDALKNDRVREVNILAPPRSGKTLIADLFVPHTMARDPGPVLWVFAVDEQAKRHCESRLMPMVKGCPQIASLLSEDRHKTRSTEIQLANGYPLRVVGNSERNLQAQARNEGHAEGYTTGQKAGILAATIFLLYGMQATAIDLWELVQRILR